MKLDEVTLDALEVADERSFRHVGLYHALKAVLARAGHRFRVPARGEAVSWSRALFLNLTFWNAVEPSDVLCERALPADVVAHVAWHHLARVALGPARGGRAHPDALFLGEAIASAFDLYLVGRLLGHAPDAEFLGSQVAAMADAAQEQGVEPEAFAALLDAVAADPERAFEDLRALLYDAARALVRCRGVADAAACLADLERRRFGCLLHHYELSNWVLYARAYGADGTAGTAAADGGDAGRAAAVDAALRAAPVALEWLETHWVTPAAGVPRE